MCSSDLAGRGGEERTAASADGDCANLLSSTSCPRGLYYHKCHQLPYSYAKGADLRCSSPSFALTDSTTSLLSLATPRSTILPLPAPPCPSGTSSFSTIALTLPPSNPCSNPSAMKSFTPCSALSAAVWMQKTETPWAIQRRREVWRGEERVRDLRPEKMGGW